MPIHRIDLPHTPTPIATPAIDDAFDDPDSNSTSNSNSVASSIPQFSLDSPSASHSSSFGKLRPQSVNSVPLLSKISGKPAKSANSLQSMLSNRSATTEYSPNLIDKECGDLLKITDLDINGNKTSNKPAKFQFHSDTDTEDDVDLENDDNINSRLSLSKTKSSLDDCGCPHVEDLSLEGDLIDYKSLPESKLREKWVFVLIGLPACGKSTMVNHFRDYVNNQTDGKVRVHSYNAGDIRRIYELQGHTKFNFNDLESSRKLRNFYAFQALKTLTTDLQNDNYDIGILDATNTSRERRTAIFNFIKDQNKLSKIKLHPLLFEIKCSNRALRRYNIDMKSQNKDYIHVDHDTAIKDFLQRIDKYEKTYEKVTVDEIKSLHVKYFGIDNVGDSIYYDCGLHHHNNIRHRNLTFSSVALNLLYRFLISYRTNYAHDYLTDVDTFYTQGQYVPIKTDFSKPVQLDEVPKISPPENCQLPKVLSSTRINQHRN